MTNLGRCLDAYQKKFDVENRDMAKEIGIGASTLSRVKGGKMPDAYHKLQNLAEAYDKGMVKIWQWLVEDAQ